MNSQEIPASDTYYFGGLTPNSTRDLPDWYKANRGISNDDTEPLINIVNSKLPCAQRANLLVENPLDEDGEPDRVHDWTAIIDPNRAELAKEGVDVKYVWNVPTSKYTIVPPVEAYSPLISTLGKHNCDSVFGEVLSRDYGGEVYIRMIFENKKVTGLPGDADSPVYLGLETGYDFKSGRSIYCNVIGIDSYSGGVIRNITEKRSRRHIGDAISEVHERTNNRVPIQDWWEEMLQRIDAMTDELTEAIKDASSTPLAFSKTADLAKIPAAKAGSFEYVKPYTASDFFQLHDMPDYLAQMAASNAVSIGESVTDLTFWELFRGLTEALDTQNRCDEGATLNSYADVAVDLLWDPKTAVTLADEQWNHEVEQEGLADDDVQQLVLSRERDGSRDLGELPLTGIQVEDDGGLLSRRKVAQQRQQSLREFAQQL